MELKSIKELVEETLKSVEMARGDDDLLYYLILEILCEKPLSEMTAKEFFINRKKYGLPSFESVRRSRQKVQEQNPWLKPADNIQNGRNKQEEKYLQFARE